MDVFGSWEHWIHLSTRSQLKQDVANWRDELQIKIKAAAIKTLLEQSRDPEKGLAAARAILGEEHKGVKRGRPSKEEVERTKRIDAGIREDLEDDMKRIGLSVVK
jgi:hypothetical protein